MVRTQRFCQHLNWRAGGLSVVILHSDRIACANVNIAPKQINDVSELDLGVSLEVEKSGVPLLATHSVKNTSIGVCALVAPRDSWLGCYQVYYPLQQDLYAWSDSVSKKERDRFSSAFEKCRGLGRGLGLLGKRATSYNIFAFPIDRKDHILGYFLDQSAIVGHDSPFRHQRTLSELKRNSREFGFVTAFSNPFEAGSREAFDYLGPNSGQIEDCATELLECTLDHFLFQDTSLRMVFATAIQNAILFRGDNGRDLSVAVAATRVAQITHWPFFYDAAKLSLSDLPEGGTDRGVVFKFRQALSELLRVLEKDHPFLVQGLN